MPLKQRNQIKPNQTGILPNYNRVSTIAVDGEAPFMQSTDSLLLFSSSLWPEVEVPVRVQFVNSPRFWVNTNEP